ncbi:hypothetical protein PC112_g21326 [Phytophthora cactorum]|nr:hypothetical protein PC112_g21326 [Phytophthora cactorum]
MINQAAKLRLKTHLQPKLRQNTRWESTYTMMARHLVLREFISAEDEELAEEMPSTATNRNLKALLGQLADAQSVAMELLCAELNLLDARDLLNGLLEVMPSFGDYLAPNAEIVHAPDFESVENTNQHQLSHGFIMANQAQLLPSTRIVCSMGLSSFRRHVTFPIDTIIKTRGNFREEQILKRDHLHLALGESNTDIDNC